MISADKTVLYFARVKSNENKRSFYKIGKTQGYDIMVDRKNLKRTEKDRFNELKAEFGNEFFEEDDIIIVRQVVIPASLKVVYNAKFHANRIGGLKKPNGGFYDDCYKISCETYEILMSFFDSYSNKHDDYTNTDYIVNNDDKEYYKTKLIKDTYYTAQDYFNEDEENWSSDEDNGSHLGDDNKYDSSDSFIASDDDFEQDDDEEYVPAKKQRKN
jgi:hypothetical protein